MKSSASSEGSRPSLRRLAGLARRELALDRLAERVALRNAPARAAVLEALREYRGLRELGASLRFGDLVVERGLLTAEGYREALAEAGLELWSCPGCGASVETAPADAAACPSCGAALRPGLPDSADPAAGAAVPRAGELLGRYRILGELGRGGAAVVYKAYDRTLRRPVALKFLKDDSKNPVLLERFRREAITLARLSHPNIVAVHETGEQDGAMYIAMELIDGASLVRFLAARDLRIRDRVALLEKVVRAVHHAHGQGVIHRDLKPGNILVSATGEPKVADFGLAHLADSQTALTKSGSAMGTPLYMAPEQVQGLSREISPRTDVYALGAILYEMLAGRPPHGGEAPMEIYGRIVGEDPVPPRTLDPQIHADLQTICLKCLEKAPSRRYSTAGELAEDLRRYLDGEPIRAHPATLISRVTRRLRRQPLTWGLGAAATAAVGVGLLLAFLLSGQRQRHVVEIAMNGAESALEAGWRERYIPVHDLTEAQGRLEQALASIDAALSAAPASAPARGGRGRLLLQLGRTGPAISSLEEAARLDPADGGHRYWLGRAFLALHDEAATRHLWIQNDADRDRAAKAADAWRERARVQFDAAVAAVRWAGEQPWEREIASAFLMARRGGVEEALAACRRIADRHPEGGEEAVLLRAGLEEARGRDAEAVAAFEEAAARARSLPEASLGAARIRIRMAIGPDAADRDPLPLLRKAVGDAETALKILPRSIPARLLRGIARVNSAAWMSGLFSLVPRPASGDPEALLLAAIDEDFSGAMALDPSRADAPFYRGDARSRLAQVRHARGGDPGPLFREAVDDCSRALALDPSHAMALSRRGSVRTGLLRLASGRGEDPAEFHRGAVDDLTAALVLQPDLVEPRMVRGQAQALYGDHLRIAGRDPSVPYQAAVDEYSALLKEDPAGASAWMLRGFVRLFWARHERAQGRDPSRLYDEAGRDFDRCLRIQPALSADTGAYREEIRKFGSGRDF